MDNSRKKEPPLTVVVPVLNEGSSLTELHRRLRNSLPPQSEILLVDDGSTDDTVANAAELAREDDLVRLVRLRRNFGKSMALDVGFRQARGRLVATFDGDLQESPEDFEKLLAKLEEGYDLVGGWRRRRQDSLFKVWGSWVFNLVVSCLGGLRVRDINCGFKVMRREVNDALTLATGFHRFIPLLAHWHGFRTAEVEIDHRPRQYGKSRYRSDRILSGLLDLVVILFLVRFEGRPGRYFVAIGSSLGLIGFGISVHLAVFWFLNDYSIKNQFPRLALGLVLIVVGVQLVSMGLFGELLAYHFRSGRNHEPAVIVDAGRRTRRSRARRRRRWRPRGDERVPRVRGGGP